MKVLGPEPCIKPSHLINLRYEHSYVKVHPLVVRDGLRI